MSAQALGSGLHALCTVCDTLLYVARLQSETRRYRGEPPKLDIKEEIKAKSAVTSTIGEWLDHVSNRSCHLCILLRHDLLDSGVDIAQENPAQSVKRSVTRVGEQGYKRIPALSVQIGEQAERPSSIEIRQLESNWEDVHAMLRGESGGKEVNFNFTPSTISQIHQWLSACETSHKACSGHEKSTSLPSRLLDVNPRALAMATPLNWAEIESLSIQSYPDVQLVPLTSLPPSPEYLTLSHCWGAGGPSLLYNNESEEAFLAGTPNSESLFSKNARTIRDAIQITRCLGFRYIWIDAFCIKQDDANDKSVEIAKMRHIYTNAVMNLSATGALDASCGMILERDALSVAPCFRYKERECEQGLSLSTKRSSPWYFAFRHRWHQEVTLAGIQTRGWVYQERLLAPRVVHFTSSQVYWECRGLLACDFYRYARSSTGYGDGVNLKTMLPNDTRVQDGQFNFTWADLCEGYATTSVTMPADRAVAFSSIAQTIAARFQLNPAEYVAGFWGRDLVRSLGWACRGFSRVNRPDSNHGGIPSWSWLHVSDGIQMAVNQNQLCVDLVDVQVETVDADDPFSAIVSGHIRLSGFVYKCHPNPEMYGVGPEDLDRNSTRWARAFGLDSVFIGPEMGVQWQWADWNRLAGKNSGAGTDGRHLHLLPLYYSDSWHWHIYGLVLTRCPERGTYVRVGSWAMDQGSEQGALATTEHVPCSDGGFSIRRIQHLLPFLRQPSNLGDDDHLEQLGEGEYLIEIR